MAILGLALFWALRFYSFVILARVVLDWVRAYNPSWRPKGFVLVAAEIVYTLTDWVIKLIRRIVPPIRLGPIAFDMGLFVIFIAIGVLQTLISRFLR